MQRFDHQKVSFAKSGLRVIGFMILMLSVPVGALILILAEILGILEEI